MELGPFPAPHCLLPGALHVFLSFSTLVLLQGSNNFVPRESIWPGAKGVSVSVKNFGICVPFSLYARPLCCPPLPPKTTSLTHHIPKVLVAPAAGIFQYGLGAYTCLHSHKLAINQPNLTPALVVTVALPNDPFADAAGLRRGRPNPKAPTKTHIRR